jgi:hypothetical protein
VTSTATQLALTCIDRGAAAVAIDLRAVRVLERAFTLSLECGSKPIVTHLTPNEARAFPGQEMGPVKLWLAVGIGRRGDGAYILRRLWIGSSVTADERDLFERAMLTELERAMWRRGIPIGMVRSW